MQVERKVCSERQKSRRPHNSLFSKPIGDTCIRVDSRPPRSQSLCPAHFGDYKKGRRQAFAQVRDEDWILRFGHWNAGQLEEPGVSTLCPSPHANDCANRCYTPTFARTKLGSSDRIQHSRCERYGRSCREQMVEKTFDEWRCK